MKDFGDAAEKDSKFLNPTSRRNFLRYTGAGIVTTGLLLSGCDDDEDPVPGGNNNGTTVSLGTGDIAILNYAYALEQLEAAFYAQVLATPYSGMTADEKSILEDIAGHELAHKDFFKAALSTNAIPALTPDFSSITFTNRSSVLTTAQAFEDLGVSAYNGAGQFISNTADGLKYLLQAGKIVSVEARHAAVIRDMLQTNNPDAFADLADANGFDLARTPAQVLDIAKTYITGVTIDASGIPTT